MGCMIDDGTKVFATNTRLRGQLVVLRYSAGQRRCVICEMFIKWDGLLCPCCGGRLRAKLRNTVDRERTAMDLSNASFNNKSQLLLVLYL